MRKTLAALALALAATAVCSGQTNTQAASQEINLGARAYRAGRFAEAEQRFRRALELDPEGKNTRLFIARAIQQQYKPGVETPENLATGERAIAAYQEILARDPAHDDAYKATVFLYGQMKRDDKVVEMLTQRANDFSLPNEKRAEAFTILASRQWQCSYDLTEQKENKTTENLPDKVVIKYKMPADAGDFLRARQCATDGLMLVEQALSLDTKNAVPMSYKANLLREAAKLAEMEGDAAGKAEYDRQYSEALAAQKRLSEEAMRAAEGAARDAPTTGVLVGEPSGRTDAAPGAPGKKVVMGGILNGKAISKPMPSYPADAKAAGVQGTVTVRILVDEAGRVAEAEAVSGPELLRNAAVTAARNSRYAPTRLSGQAVKVSGHITYNFVLQ